MNIQDEKIILKMLEILDKIRMNTDILIQLYKGNKMPIAKKDYEVISLLQRKNILDGVIKDENK